MMMVKVKPLLAGLGAAIALLSVYFLLLSLANSFSHAVEQFVLLWPWMMLLTAGFGVQVWLYAYMRERATKEKVRGAVASISASSGISTTSMAACCAHHFADVLPLLGVSAISIFLVRYQVSFLLIGVVSSLAGILLMLSMMKKHRLYNGKSLLAGKVFRVDFRKLLFAEVAIGIAAVIISFVRAGW